MNDDVATPRRARCALCHGDVRITRAASACPDCDTLLHEDCARSLGRCPTLYCTGRPRRSVPSRFRPPGPPSPLGPLAFTLLVGIAALAALGSGPPRFGPAPTRSPAREAREVEPARPAARLPYGWSTDPQARRAVVSAVERAGMEAPPPPALSCFAEAQIRGLPATWRALEAPDAVIRRAAMDLVSEHLDDDDARPWSGSNAGEQRLLARRCDPMAEPVATIRLLALDALLRGGVCHDPTATSLPIRDKTIPRDAVGLALDDPDPRVEALAIAWFPVRRERAQGWWRPMLEPALADDDPLVRRAAATALRGIEDADVGFSLAARLLRASGGERARLAEAVALRMRGPWEEAQCVCVHRALCRIAVIDPGSGALGALASSGHAFVHPDLRTALTFTRWSIERLPAPPGARSEDYRWRSLGIGCGRTGSSARGEVSRELPCGHVEVLETVETDEVHVDGGRGRWLSERPGWRRPDRGAATSRLAKTRRDVWGQPVPRQRGSWVTTTRLDVWRRRLSTLKRFVRWETRRE